jgi:hypothetical protein
MWKVSNKTEYELFDVGWINTPAYLNNNFDGYGIPPLWISFVIGYVGKVHTSPEQIIHMKMNADKLFG